MKLRFVFRYVVVALAVIIGSSFLAWDSVLRCVRGVITVKHLENQIREISGQANDKKNELDRFKDDFCVENMARQELGLARPNETEYRFTKTTEGP